MLSKVVSATVVGLEGMLVEVEVDVANRGFPTFTIVGLPDKAIDEAKERVRTAISHAALEMPDSRITVNLAPADIHKIGSGFDLPIAIGVLSAAGVVTIDGLNNSILVGELSLEGRVRRVPGMISIALLAKEKQINTLFVPQENAAEAALVDGLTIYPIQTLSQAIAHLNGEERIAPFIAVEPEYKEAVYDFNMADIKGQEQAKRVMEIAAAGFHNLHLKGPPGAGKTMLSRAFPSILPSLTREEIVEVSRIYSVSGQIIDSPLIQKRPFRAPHHTTSRIGLIGGGSYPVPGEISLAHRGILFLDEFPEFPRSVLESLRQPLEDGKVTISRASGSMTFPCKFLLLAASNPCPCGYLGHPKKICKCMPGMILNYKKKLSGPLLDRIDLHIDVPPVDEEKLTSLASGELSQDIRKRVVRAREIQIKRFQDSPVYTNAHMSSVEVRKYCILTKEAVELLKQAISRLSLSARSYFKIIKVARTIADLEEAPDIEVRFIAEALQYRVKEE